MSSPLVTRAPLDRPPFAVELTVFEEDTYRVLSAGNFARDVRTDVEELIGEMSSAALHSPGELIVKGNRAYAIVYDLAREQICEGGWIETALDALAVHCEAGGIRSVAIQPLGCRDQTLGVPEFEVRLKERMNDTRLERIWLVE